jgi:hypothetical protein
MIKITVDSSDIIIVSIIVGYIFIAMIKIIVD